jgi:hypothetical protein
VIFGSILFTELAQKFGIFFARQKLCIDFDEKIGLGYILGAVFFANSSGHPSSEAEIEESLGPTHSKSYFLT